MRFAVFIALLIAAFIAPWKIFMLALMVSVVLFRRFYAALIPALLTDIIHGGASLTQQPLHSATLLTALALLLLSFLEGYLRDDVRV